jgi:hypothetical protein
VERAEVPEIAVGAYVLVRGLTGTQRDAYEKSMWVQKGRKSVRSDNLRAKLIVKCLVDDQGNLQYADADIAVIGACGRRARTCLRCVPAAVRHDRRGA